MADLLFVPTRVELDRLEKSFRSALTTQQWQVEICGFGPIAAASRTATLIARHRPARALLIGIAGSYTPSLPVGTASRFYEVACDGIGVGLGNNHRTASELGWPQLEHGADQPDIGDVIQLVKARQHARSADRRRLLTCCSASATPDEAAHRLESFPTAVAEDMEGFGVALSCRCADVPLEIVRGISNLVGDRDHLHWKLDEAMIAAQQLALELITSPGTQP